MSAITRSAGHKLSRAAAVAAALLAAGCSRSETANGAGQPPATNQAAPPAGPALAAREGAVNAQATAPVTPEPEPAAVGEEEERRGPTRKARCRIDNGPEQACDFTPVFGDGSFDIEMPDRQLRLIVNGDEAAPFELIGKRRIPIVGLLRRDPADHACWVSNEPGLALERVCAR